MSLFLAAAAGFLSGKAELAKAKREEERQIREEERLLERQQNLYKFQYDIQRRTQLDADAEENAKKVKALLRILPIDEDAAINVVNFGLYDFVMDNALKDKIDPLAVQARLGSSEGRAPPAPPDPAELTVDAGTPAASSYSGTGFLRTETEDGATIENYNSFERSLSSVLQGILPEGSYRVVQAEDGSGFHIFASSQRVAQVKANIVREAWDAYQRLIPEIGKRLAYVKVNGFLSSAGQQIINFDDPNQLEAFIYRPLQEGTLRISTPAPAASTLPPPGGESQVPINPAGVIPGVGAWNPSAFGDR